MLPEASDDFRQQNRFLDNSSPLPQDNNRGIPEHEPSGKSKKKGKAGSKGKDKGAKAAKPPEQL